MNNIKNRTLGNLWETLPGKIVIYLENDAVKEQFVADAAADGYTVPYNIISCLFENVNKQSLNSRKIKIKHIAQDVCFVLLFFNLNYSNMTAEPVS